MNAIFLSVLLSVPPQAPPLVPVQAPPIVRTDCGCAYGEPCGCVVCTCLIPAYDTASKRCAVERKPLVVFVNVKPRPVVGLSICTATECFDDKTPRILVAMPAGDWLEWKADLPATVSDDAIRAVVHSKITQQRKEARLEAPIAIPFRQPIRISGGRSSASC